MARPTEPENTTIATIRIVCDDAGAMQNLLRALEGALGKPAKISRPYANADGATTRVYLDIVVPRAPVGAD